MLIQFQLKRALKKMYTHLDSHTGFHVLVYKVTEVSPVKRMLRNRQLPTTGEGQFNMDGDESGKSRIQMD